MKKKTCGSNVMIDVDVDMNNFVFLHCYCTVRFFCVWRKYAVFQTTFVSSKMVVSKSQNWPVHFFIFLCQRVDVQDEYRRPLLHNLILIICVALTAAAVEIQACSMTFLKAVAKKKMHFTFSVVVGIKERLRPPRWRQVNPTFFIPFGLSSLSQNVNLRWRSE